MLTTLFKDGCPDKYDWTRQIYQKTNINMFDVIRKGETISSFWNDEMCDRNWFWNVGFPCQYSYWCDVSERQVMLTFVDHMLIAQGWTFQYLSYLIFLICFCVTNATIDFYNVFNNILSQLFNIFLLGYLKQIQPEIWTSSNKNSCLLAGYN